MNSLLTVWGCVVFKLILGLFIFLLDGNLNAAEQESDSPNRAGSIRHETAPGPLLRDAIDGIERQKKTEQGKWSSGKGVSPAVGAGTVLAPCHRPDNHPHEGHSHQGNPTPYSAKKH